jgi:hypothetical protein
VVPGRSDSRSAVTLYATERANEDDDDPDALSALVR